MAWGPAEKSAPVFLETRMKTYHAKFLRLIEADIQAENMEAAKIAANQIVKQFPPDTMKVFSITADDYKEPPDAPSPAPTPIAPPPGGNPVGGGTPSGGQAKLPEPLVDQIAVAA